MIRGLTSSTNPQGINIADDVSSKTNTVNLVIEKINQSSIDEIKHQKAEDTSKLHKKDLNTTAPSQNKFDLNITYNENNDRRVSSTNDSARERDERSHLRRH